MEIVPGKNIAIKVPLHKYEETVAFYRDKVGLKVAKELTNSVGFAFGNMTLWIDRVEKQSQVDVWLDSLPTIRTGRWSIWKARSGTSWSRLMRLTGIGPRTRPAWCCLSGMNEC